MRVLLCEHLRFGVTSFSRFAGAKEMTHIVTGRELPRAMAQRDGAARPRVLRGRGRGSDLVAQKRPWKRAIPGTMMLLKMFGTQKGRSVSENSGITIARRVVSIGLVVLTGLVALLWAWPQFGNGGFVWSLTAPVGVAFAYLVHLLTAPRSARRSLWVPIGIVALLALLWFIGLMIAALSAPTDPNAVLSNQLTFLVLALFLWPWVMAGGLFVLLILKFADRTAKRSDEKARTAQLAPAPALPVTQSPAPFASGGSPHTGPVPAQRSYDPAGSLRPQTPTAAVTPRQPYGASGPSSGTAPQTIDEPGPTSSVPSPPAPSRAEVASTGIPLDELSTLVEIAMGMGREEASVPLTLGLGPGGVTVAADDVPLGSVNGGWTGEESATVTLLASEVLQVLHSIEPSTQRITVVLGDTEHSAAEFRADGSDQSVSVPPFRA